jgi:hypothetical protein
MEDNRYFVKDLEGRDGGIIGVLTRYLSSGTGEEHEKFGQDNRRPEIRTDYVKNTRLKRYL